MIVLAIDSAGQGCGICVWREGNAVSSLHEPMARGQDKRLIPMIAEALRTAGISFSDIDRVAVSRGPGSFTGLRIGLAAAQGIGLAHNLPVLGFDRFDLLARQANGKNVKANEELLIVLASQRQELFCRLDPSPTERGTPALMTLEEIGILISARPNLRTTGDTRPPNASNWLAAWQPEAVTCAAIAAESDPADPALPPSPLYLRSPDVTLSASALTLEPLGLASPISMQEQTLTLAALHAESFGHSAWKAAQLEQTLALPTTSGALLRQNGVPAGFVLLQLTKPEAEILTFCVNPALRERGLGARLLDAALRNAVSAECETIFLEVASDNPPALKLYEKAGFKLIGERKGYYARGASRADALTFAKSLNRQN